MKKQKKTLKKAVAMKKTVRKATVSTSKKSLIADQNMFIIMLSAFVVFILIVTMFFLMK